MDNIFIEALVRAGTCKGHGTSIGGCSSSVVSRFSSYGSQKGSVFRQRSQRAGFHSKTAKHEPAAALATIPREDLYNLVDIYGSYNEREYSTIIDFQSPSETAPPFHPRATDGPSRPRPPGDSSAIQEFQTLIRNPKASPEKLYEAYRQIQSPAPLFLPRKWMDELLHRLSLVNEEDEGSMMRYLSILDDLKAADMPIARREWNNAIRFAARCFRKISDAEVEGAIYLWKEMESTAGVQSDHVTFNILLDIAVKSRKMGLADRVLEEMQRRKLKHDRYFHFARILYFGQRFGGNAIRHAYRQFIDSGQIVDTAVLNVVIEALITAGEGPAADHVFERMKVMTAERIQPHAPYPSNWQHRRELTKMLRDFSEIYYTTDKDAWHQLELTTPIAPSMDTYCMLISYHATIGDIDRVLELISEMHAAGIEPGGRLLIHLMKGFRRHGGIRYSSWTKQRLEALWKGFLQAAQAHPTTREHRRALAPAVVLAFDCCVGRRRAGEVLREVEGRWEVEEETVEYILSRMGRGKGKEDEDEDDAVD
ncbi:hypothetical protein P152DRAFT_400010 [Eremomyces bilateralis CBS 781.70]|uniref:Pentatricopeptide repeat protein n=1 Tax=Eremomyces bilateralis CBS 781.70 TaxID=1392243 RepID=A0A6G1FZC5_9PEZI|nr:uncharacterized protein P152DRAFT_400010 [Eremomyces bilateralis CBS 781.70]KAF1811144.1 hypothetical protein P152DRAFT_400010 [Eremomyces bilateralis CBS 781.70]